MSRSRESLRSRLQQRVISGLHLGRLRVGERLGSARQVAREAGADYRTVVAALRGLERDGLVQIRPRAGLYLGERSWAWPRPAGAFAERLADLVLEAADDGLSVAMAAERLGRALSTAGLRAACIECNDDQLYFLCAELVSGFGLDSKPIEIARLRGRTPVELREADVLVSTTFHAGEVRRWAARLGKECILVTLDPQRYAEVTWVLRERPVYFVGTDPRWAEKARQIWAGEPGAERLHMLTLGRDSLADLPPEAVVMLMPRARAWLGDGELVRRALPHRGFSPQTTRQIVHWLLRANGLVAAAAPG